VRHRLRLALSAATALAAGWMLRVLRGVPSALGASLVEIGEVAARSPHFGGGRFRNVDPSAPLSIDREQQWALARDLLGGRAAARPHGPIPLMVPPGPGTTPHRLAVSWYGHSTAVVEVDGYRVLTDPVWSRRCSPSRIVGPQRLHPMPAPLEALPAIDVVVISHDHYDHLDVDTIRGLARTQRAPFFVPLGVGAHLRRWGIPDNRIVELDWFESAQLGDLTLTCTPARHFSGRSLARNTTLWASWVVIGPSSRVFFGGDTGYTKSFTQIGADHGPFDLTLLPVGAYHPAWPDIHMNPEEAIRAHLDLADPGRGLLVPIHWATFQLAPHPWAEPVERLLAAADPAGVGVAVPKPGARVDPETASAFDPWWRPANRYRAGHDRG